MLRALHFSHVLLKETIATFPNGIFIDGTLGKGNDLHFILSQSHFNGKGYGFDIQDEAIRLSTEKLKPFPNAIIIQDSHDTVEKYLANEPVIHGAIYNLGYLPGGNHDITTQFESTIRSIRQVATKLAPKGRILLVVYSGHPSGMIEKEHLFTELATWEQTQFKVLHYGFINQRNNPPLLLAIERL